MSRAELTEIETLGAELGRYRHAAGRRSAWRPQDHIQAAGQAFGRSYGLHRDAELHPLAEDVVRSGPFGLLDLAETIFEVNDEAIPSRGADGFRPIVRALSTADFPSIFQETFRGIAAERKTLLLDSILALTHQLEVDNYNAQSYSLVDLAGLPTPRAATGSDYHPANAILAGEATQVFSLFAKLLVSRQSLVNDDRNFIRSAIAAFINIAHRNELKQLVSLIEANANLTDGSPIFGSGTGNETTAAMAAAGLGTAFAALHSQPTESGDATDAQAHALLVHADDEVAALGLVEALPENRRPMVIASTT